MKYLITYDTERVIAIVEAPGQGVNIVSGSNYLIDTLENAEIIFAALNLDITELDRYKNSLFS